MSAAADVLAGGLGLLFLFGGSSKVAGLQMHRENFRRWRYPDWFRVFTGGWELVGGALLLAGVALRGLGLAGASLILAAMVGAVYTHLVRVSEPVSTAGPALLLGAAAVLLAVSL